MGSFVTQETGRNRRNITLDTYPKSLNNRASFKNPLILDILEDLWETVMKRAAGQAAPPLGL